MAKKRLNNPVPVANEALTASVILTLIADFCMSAGCRPTKQRPPGACTTPVQAPPDSQRQLFIGRYHSELLTAEIVLPTPDLSKHRTGAVRRSNGTRPTCFRQISSGRR